MTTLHKALNFRQDRKDLKDRVMHDIRTGVIPIEEIQNLPIDLLDLSALPQVPPQNIMTESIAYKPFRYPVGYDVFIKQNRVHWLPDEVPLGDDVKDWRTKLTPAEVSLIYYTFRLFTQNDLLANNIYLTQYARYFKSNEVLMAISAISNIESIHQAAYSHLLDTMGMPETEYSAFREYQVMADKYDYMQSFKTDTLFGLALALIVFGGMLEGVQLFASFIMLLNFPRNKKELGPSTMKGMGQIVAWSMRDESLHVSFVSHLYGNLMAEFGGLINKPLLTAAVIESTKQIQENEFRYIDLAFGLGPVPGLTAQDTKDFISYMVDRRLAQFGMPSLNGTTKNPLPWVESEMNNIEHTSFFENRATEYSRASTRGTWEEAFASYKSIHAQPEG